MCVCKFFVLCRETRFKTQLNRQKIIGGNLAKEHALGPRQHR